MIVFFLPILSPSVATERAPMKEPAGIAATMAACAVEVGYTDRTSSQRKTIVQAFYFVNEGWRIEIGGEKCCILLEKERGHI